MSRIRRQIWVRRLSLPVAFLVGAAISARPLMQLIDAVSGLFEFIPQSLASNLNIVSAAQVPQMQSFLLGATLLLAVLMAGKLVNR
jgi:hypothetical protein